MKRTQKLRRLLRRRKIWLSSSARRIQRTAAGFRGTVPLRDLPARDSREDVCHRERVRLGNARYVRRDRRESARYMRRDRQESAKYARKDRQESARYVLRDRQGKDVRHREHARQESTQHMPTDRRERVRYVLTDRRQAILSAIPDRDARREEGAIRDRAVRDHAVTEEMPTEAMWARLW